MKLSDIPKVDFWPYDLFGYMLPGATFVTALAIGESRASTFLRDLWTSHALGNYLLLAFIAYIAGTMVSAISSLLIEQGFLQVTFKYPTSRLFPDYVEKRPKFWRWLTKQWFYAPARWAGHFIAPTYCNPAPEPFQKAVKDTYEHLFQSDFPRSHTRFWLCWGFISLHHPAAYRRGAHFVELYGFSRNTCMSFLLIASLPLLSIDRFPFTLWTFDTWEPPVDWFNWTLPSLLLALVFFANYLKLFRRMDDEMFHSFLVAAKARLLERPAALPTLDIPPGDATLETEEPS